MSASRGQVDQVAGRECAGTSGDVENRAAAEGGRIGAVSTLRDRLRSTPSVTGRAPDWDSAAAPENPRDLFVEWLLHAIDSGAVEPLAVTLSTADGNGAPDARVVMLKDVTEDFGMEIATGAEGK